MSCKFPLFTKEGLEEITKISKMVYKKTQTISVFILAAGLGERLRPITNYIPKPLLPILGKPVLQSVLESLSGLSIYKIGINLHHKKEVIKNWISQSEFNKDIELFPEDPILGTGGALKNAEVLLKNRTFLVYNSDIVSDMDLGKLIEFHLSSENLVTLAVHDYPEFNTIEIDEKGLLKGILKHPHPLPPPSMGREIKANPPNRLGISAKKSSFSAREDTDNNPPSPDGRVIGGGGRFLAFTGIAVYQPEFLKFLPTGISSVVDAWLKSMREGFRIGTLDVTGCYWNDIGTPLSYAKAAINELRKNGEMIYIHPSVFWCKDTDLDGYVVIENESNPPLPFAPGRIRRDESKRGMGRFSGKNVYKQGISLRNCIVLPEAKIEYKEVEDASPTPPFDKNILISPAHAKDTPPSPPLTKGGMGGSFENCILGPGFKIDFSELDLFDSTDSNTFLIGTGGSDRKYYRVRSDNHSAVLMQCADDDPDFQRHIEYTRFFQKYSIPVPELLDVNPDKKSASFEDLGDMSLHRWLKCPRGQEDIEKIYKQVIDILVLIHAAATEPLSECPLLRNRIFDYEHLRWETSYFIQRFVEGVMNIRINNASSLEEEFHRLAMKVNSFHKTIIHRDFQSQNIMITKGRIPRLLDYQGARIGPPAYDLASILWDPYCRLADNLRERLLDYYIAQIKKITLPTRALPGEPHPPAPPLPRRKIGGVSEPENMPESKSGEKYQFVESEFRGTVLPCRLQRHMQALGAYGFLSSVKGKKYFLKYIPEGLRLLREDLVIAKNEFPVLDALVREL